jgi:hypothetical protein
MRETAPNNALEPTASSFGFAYASGGGSAQAFGVYRVHQYQPLQGEEWDTHDRDKRP